MASEYEHLLMGLIGSLTLADHMGDAAGDVHFVLKQLGIETPHADDSDDWWSGLAKDLHLLGVKTLHDTALADEEGDD